jgi:hypothetical protein
MLKIKDNVDLKELEKFGYTDNFVTNCGTSLYVKSDNLYDLNVRIFVEEDRTFFIEWGEYLICGDEQERFLQDLIDADLVEKVEDK